MKSLIYILMAVIICSCNNITGNGHIKTENRNVGEFDGVQASGSMDIEITDGDNVSVQIEADDNILPYIVAEVDNGLLDVHFKSNTSFSDIHAKVYVTAPGLKRLFVKGSGSIVTKNTIKTSGSISTKISGSGDINATVDARDVKADISGSGNLSLKGGCKNFEGTISGNGDLKCRDLLSEDASISIFGSGAAHVFASVHLNASTAGSGGIYYSGKPSSTQINKSGSGTIQPE